MVGDKDGDDKEVIRLNRNRKYIRKKKEGVKGMIKEKEKESSNESNSKRANRVKIIRSEDVCV